MKKRFLIVLTVVVALCVSAAAVIALQTVHQKLSVIIEEIKDNAKIEREKIENSLTGVEIRYKETATAIEKVTEGNTAVSETIEELQTENRRLSAKLAVLENTIESTAMMTAVNTSKIKQVHTSITVDSQALLNAMLYPTVQIFDGNATGSGTVIYSQKSVRRGQYDNYVLTAFHIVSNYIMQKQKGERAEKSEIIIRVYRSPSGIYSEYKAELVIYNPHIDTALLQFSSANQQAVATSIHPGKLNSLDIFDEVYVVGCPLGLMPSPTSGTISNISKEVGRNKLWVVSAPVIFGNSGGGVYLKENNVLIGMISMICSYDSIVSIPVPHMGIAVPMTKIYDWLDEHCYQFLYDERYTIEACAEKRGNKEELRVKKE